MCVVQALVRVLLLEGSVHEYNVCAARQNPCTNIRLAKHASEVSQDLYLHSVPISAIVSAMYHDLAPSNYCFPDMSKAPSLN